MGNSNVHNHKRCPLFLAGHAGGALKGNLHLKAADGTPMANAMLAALQRRRRRASTVRRQHRGDGSQHGCRRRRLREDCQTAAALQITRAWLDRRGIARVVGALHAGAATDVADAAKAQRRGGGEGAAEAGRRRECRAGRRHDGAALGRD